MKLVGNKTPVAGKEFKMITIRWPADTRVPVIHGRWQRLPDGRIQAIYAHDELVLCLSIAELLRS